MIVLIELFNIFFLTQLSSIHLYILLLSSFFLLLKASHFALLYHYFTARKSFIIISSIKHIVTVIVLYNYLMFLFKRNASLFIHAFYHYLCAYYYKKHPTSLCFIVVLTKEIPSSSYSIPSTL